MAHFSRRAGATFLFLICASITQAQTKVVVVPLGGDPGAETNSFKAFNTFDSQEITNSGDYLITFSGEDDPDGVFDLGSQLFSAPEDGRYFFSSTFRVSGNDGINDGVIFSLCRDANHITSNRSEGGFTVLSPGFVGQSGDSVALSGVFPMTAGETMGLCITGVDGTDFAVRYANFSGFRVK